MKSSGLKDDNGGRKSITLEDTIKEQAEVVKLAARDLNQMGFEVEELGQFRPDLGETKGDAEGTLLDLATSGYYLAQGQRKSEADSMDKRVDKGKSDAGPEDGKIGKEKERVCSETQPSIIQMKHSVG
ncbi:hypothetical protein SLA2020_063380 [Shorea laevis]